LITIEHIFREDVEELVRLAYEGDTELFEKYHLKPNMTFEEAVEGNMFCMDDTAKSVDFDYYKVLFNGEPIGYFVTFPECLYSFAIGMKWRTKEILIEVFNKIKESLGNKFACLLYKNNSRAINWLLKCEMKQVEVGIDEDSVSLYYNN